MCALNIHERFLRHIWNQQYLRQAALHTVDGRGLRVLGVGTLNTDGGPDFRNALLRIGDTTYRGDIEIHRTLLDWLRHRHHDDPRYNGVILHVVLERPPQPLSTLVPSGRSLPLLVLEPFLSTSIRRVWEKAILDERCHARSGIPCRNENHDVPPDVVLRWIRRLTLERLELKLRRFDERLRELAQICLFAVHDHIDGLQRWRIQGDPDDIPPPFRELTPRELSRREFWDQILYEGLMEGLGYSKNREPFLRLARAVTIKSILSRGIHDDTEALQALLLGAAGLLPPIKSVRDEESRTYLRSLTRLWRKHRDFYRASVLHAADWQLFPTRPGNFPTLRIAAACVLIDKILRADLFRTLMEALKASSSGIAALRSIRSLLAVAPHPFWIHHYRFGAATVPSIQSLGERRIDELITNTIVPLALLYARTFRDRAIRRGTLQLFDSMRAPGENSITRLLEKQLLHDKVPVTSAALQQGLLQLYTYYCREERCGECEIGERVFGEH